MHKILGAEYFTGKETVTLLFM